MMHLLENISPSAFVGLVLLGMLAYFLVTAIIIKNKPGRLWIPATLLLLLSTLFYSAAY